jgi:hypothetical protein
MRTENRSRNAECGMRNYGTVEGLRKKMFSLIDGHLSKQLSAYGAGSIAHGAEREGRFALFKERFA